MELDVAKSPVTASWSQASSTESSGTKSPLASNPLAGKHGRSQCMFRSHFLTMVPVLKSSLATASSKQETLFGFSPS